MADSSGRTIMVVGRIVWAAGDLFKGETKKDFTTRQPKLDQAGQPMMQYGFGLAVPKANIAEIWTAMHEEAFQLYPSRQLPPMFAMKFQDGDGVDSNGAQFSQRQGYAGHLVFAMTTSLPVKYFRNDNGNTVLINEGIKCGDYVQVQLSIKAHGVVGQNGRPGLYLNPNAVLFLGYGPEIVNTPSGDQIFGNTLPPLPPGASAQPLASSSFAPPAAAPIAYAPPAPSPYNPAPAAAPSWQQPAPAPAAAPPAPHHAVLPPQYQPQAAPQMPQAPPAYAPPQMPQAPQGMPPMPGMPR